MELTINELKDKWELPGDHLIVVYDNNDSPPNLRGLNLEKSWGFSAAIKFNGKSILFDCGWSGNIELNNLKKLNIPADKFDFIIISHQHWDHMGGLADIADKNPGSVIFLPGDFSDKLTEELKKRVRTVHRVKYTGEPTEIFSGLYVTGNVKVRNTIGEQSAVIRGRKYDLLLVGCMHPGLKPIYKMASRIINPNALLGGIHGFKDIKYLMATKLKDLFLGHCTTNFEMFQGLPGISNRRIYPGFYLEL